MDSPWQNPLPIDDYTNRQVVVYFHSDYFWIPINCFGLSEAIALYRKALQRGKELFVFPPGLSLETQNILSPQTITWQKEQI